MANRGEKVKIVTDFIYLDFQITVYSDCSHEIRIHLFLRRKAMKNLDSVLNTRDNTLATKVCIVKVMLLPLVMYGYDNWAIRKAEHRRIDACKLWCWRRVLRVLESLESLLETARRPN